LSQLLFSSNPTGSWVMGCERTGAFTEVTTAGTAVLFAAAATLALGAVLLAGVGFATREQEKDASKFC
jgi:hypothetical protein